MSAVLSFFWCTQRGAGNHSVIRRIAKGVGASAARRQGPMTQIIPGDPHERRPASWTAALLTGTLSSPARWRAKAVFLSENGRRRGRDCRNPGPDRGTVGRPGFLAADLPTSAPDER